MYGTAEGEIVIRKHSARSRNVLRLNHIAADIQDINRRTTVVARMPLGGTEPDHRDDDAAGIGRHAGIRWIGESDRPGIRRRPERTRVVWC